MEGVGWWRGWGRGGQRTYLMLTQALTCESKTAANISTIDTEIVKSQFSSVLLYEGTGKRRNEERKRERDKNRGTFRMHMLCKYYFVRIVADLFVGPFN